jgi:drug/metabolite transporter (DMT)-like permease
MFLALMLGASYTLTEVALEGFDPVTLVLVRLIIGAVFIALWMRARSQPLPSGGAVLRLLVIIGLLNTIGSFLLITWGQEYVTASYTAILVASNAIFAAIGATLVLPSERLTIRRGVGVLVGFVGVVFLFVDQLGWSNGEHHGLLSVLGALAILGGAIGLAIVALTVRSKLPSLLPAQLAFPMLITGVVSVALFEGILLISGDVHARAAPRPGPILAAAVLGLLNAGIGNVVYYTLIRAWGVTRTALVGYVVPMIGVALGVGLLHDELGPAMIVGLVFILASLVFVNPATTPVAATSLPDVEA